TSISYDHTAILGRTLGQIASEKAGILRTGRPALLAEQRPAAMRVLLQVCRGIGARCRVIGPREADGYRLALEGSHQRQNAALAVAAAHLLVPDMDRAAIERGLARLKWPGRFEVLPGRPTIVLD